MHSSLEVSFDHNVPQLKLSVKKLWYNSSQTEPVPGKVGLIHEGAPYRTSRVRNGSYNSLYWKTHDLIVHSVQKKKYSDVKIFNYFKYIA